MTGPRTGSDFDDLANDYRKEPDYEHPSRYDPYWPQRVEEQKQAKLARMKEKLKGKSGKNPSRAKQQREPATSIAKVLTDRERKNSRVKGSRAELDVASLFSRWCGEHVRRTPLSGGWSSARFGVTADLVCAKKAFPFHVEVKHREGWTLDDLVTGVRSDHDKSIVQWWKQCTTTCPKKKEPLLAFRRNRQPWLVMYRTQLDSPNHFTVDDEAVSVELLVDFLERAPVPSGLKNYRRS